MIESKEEDYSRKNAPKTQMALDPNFPTPTLVTRNESPHLVTNLTVTARPIQNIGAKRAFGLQ